MKNIWILQTGEPLQSDEHYRPMRAINLSNTLSSMGHNVTIISSDFFHQEKRHRKKFMQTFEVNELLRINFITSPGYKRNIGFSRLIDHFILSINLKKYLTSVTQLPDIVFIGYPPIETSFTMAKWLHSKNIPFVVDLKDQWPQIFLDPFPSFLQPLLKLLLFPYFFMGIKTLRLSSAFVSMSFEYIQWMKEFSKDPDKKFFVAPLTTRSNQNQSESLALTKWFESQDIDLNVKARFCFIGSFMSVFDFSLIRDASTRLNSEGLEHEIILCGDGDYLSQTKELFRGIENIKFTGWINEEQVRAIYSISNASLIPYKNIENYKINTPNKVIDAFANATPIITSLEGVVATYCTSNNVGFACNESSGTSFFEAMKRLILDKSLNKEMSDNAIRLYESKFSFDAVYGDLSNFLIDIIA